MTMVIAPRLIPARPCEPTHPAKPSTHATHPAIMSGSHSRVLCFPSALDQQAAGDASAVTIRRRRMHALALVRLWREVLNGKLGSPRLLSYSSRTTMSGLNATMLLHLAITNSIRLPTSIDESAAWAVPSACERWSVRPGHRPRESCPLGRCMSCDARRPRA